MNESFDVGLFFEEGGWTMYVITALGFLGLALAFASLASLFGPSRRVPIGVGLASLFIAVMALGMGVGGTVIGRLPGSCPMNADAESRDLMRARGDEESDNNVWLGGIACMFPFLCGALAVACGLAMKDKPRSESTE